ncbi:MAG: hypothetical protein K2W96_22735, partial [Gemmataceae bacterium]|nr:hypothetical protein [Gemmataceae bacterium]
MAPEQARGEADKVGPASDVFGLGAVLFHLLAGRPPISGADSFTLHQKAMRGEVDAGLLERSGAPAALRRLCLRALASDPKRRPSPLELAEELERAARPTRRWIVAAGAAVVAGLAALGWVLWPKAEAETKLPPAPGVQPLVKLFVSRGMKQEPRLAPAVLTGDEVQVQFETPAGSHWALWWLDAESGLKSHPTAVVGEGKLGPRSRFPKERLAKVTGKPGTEIVLVVCSRESRPLPSEAAVRAALGKDWPALGAKDVPLLMHPGGVEEGYDPRGLEEGPATALTQARARLEALREALRKECDWAWAAAVPHL